MCHSYQLLKILFSILPYPSIKLPQTYSSSSINAFAFRVWRISWPWRFEGNCLDQSKILKVVLFQHQNKFNEIGFDIFTDLLLNLRWFPSLYSLLNNLILLFLIIFFRITTIRWFKSRSVLFLFSLFIFFSINFSLSLLLLLLCSQTNFHSNLKLGENDDDIWIWFSVTIILNFFLLNFSCNSVHVFAVALHISLRACSLLTPLEGDSITQLVAENISCDLSLTFLISLPRSRISWASSGWHVNSFIPTTFHHSLFQKNKTQHSL